MIISKYWRRRGDHTCASCCAAPPGVRQCGQPCNHAPASVCNHALATLCVCVELLLAVWQCMQPCYSTEGQWTMCSAGIHVWWYSLHSGVFVAPCPTTLPIVTPSHPWPVMTPLTVLWCLGTPPVVSGKLHQNLWVSLSPSYNVLLHIMRSHSRPQQQQKTNRHFPPFHLLST